VDLHHLAGNVASATGHGRIADACRDVQRMIDGDETRSPIIAEGHAGASMAPARGISIYFPLLLDRSAFYRELDFASATHWADLLEACVGKGRTPADRVPEPRGSARGGRGFIRAVTRGETPGEAGRVEPRAERKLPVE
jgi:hypothetical protein